MEEAAGFGDLTLCVPGGAAERAPCALASVLRHACRALQTKFFITSSAVNTIGVLRTMCTTGNDKVAQASTGSALLLVGHWVVAAWRQAGPQACSCPSVMECPVEQLWCPATANLSSEQLMSGASVGAMAGSCVWQCSLWDPPWGGLWPPGGRPVV